MAAAVWCTDSMCFIFPKGHSHTFWLGVFRHDPAAAACFSYLTDDMTSDHPITLPLTFMLTRFFYVAANSLQSESVYLKNIQYIQKSNYNTLSWIHTTEGIFFFVWMFNGNSVFQPVAASSLTAKELFQSQCSTSFSHYKTVIYLHWYIKHMAALGHAVVAGNIMKDYAPDLFIFR